MPSDTLPQELKLVVPIGRCMKLYLSVRDPYVFPPGSKSDNRKLLGRRNSQDPQNYDELPDCRSYMYEYVTCLGAVSYLAIAVLRLKQSLLDLVASLNMG